MHSIGRIVEYSLLQKLTQISVRQVLHDNRYWLPLPNNAQHLCYVGITDVTQLLHRLIKCSSAKSSKNYQEFHS